MALFNDIVLNDGATTPVAKTFAARSNINGTATYVHDASGAPAVAGSKIVIQTKPAKAPDGYHFVDVKMTIPLVDTPPGAAPKEVHQTAVVISFKLSGRAPVTDRNHILAYAKNVLANTQVSEAVLSLAPPR
jgi:hypothetical protein